MEKIIQMTMEFIKKKQIGEATGHDWWHTERVYKTAMELCNDQKGIKTNVVALAALLHDIEDWKFNGGDESAGPKAARKWMSSIGVSQDVQDHVAEIIFDLSYKGTEQKSQMKTIEGMVVQDADRLDALGAIGIARTFAFGGHFGNEIFNPEIEPRLIIDSDAYKDRAVKSSTINHFYEKLLNLVNLMNTDQAKEIAKRRHDYMISFLKEFLNESRYVTGLHRKFLEEIIKH